MSTINPFSNQVDRDKAELAVWRMAFANYKKLVDGKTEFNVDAIVALRLLVIQTDYRVYRAANGWLTHAEILIEKLKS